MWQGVAAATSVGGWTAPQSQSETTTVPAEEQRRADELVSVAKRHPDAASRERLSTLDKIKATYGDFVRTNGRSQQTYRQADRHVVLRIVMAAERSGQKVSKSRIESMLRQISPTMARMGTGDQDKYLKSMVNRIAHDPQLAQIRLNKDLAMRAKDHSPQRSVADSAPAQNTAWIMAAYRPEVTPAKPEPPPIENERQIYRNLNMQIKADARRNLTEKDSRVTDIEIAKELKMRGHSQAQIERVLSHSPYIRNMSAPDKETNIKDICSKATQQIEDLRAHGERSKLWFQSIQQQGQHRGR